MTVQQAKDLREAVLRERNADPIAVIFDHIGHSLIAAGKIREGLTAYRQVAAQHPKEAPHKVQLAQALLTTGLGEQARTVAKEATTLEPDSALAFTTLGMVLSHDLIGRLLKKGMDYDGAVAAYERAIALDPKDKQSRADLALLLEYDPDGTRYGENARLKEAVREFRELKRIDEEYGCRFDNNILYDLWYARSYQEVIDYAATLPTSETKIALRLAASAVQQGSNAALKTSLDITTDDETRSKAPVAAGDALVRVHRYAEGAMMFAEGARGQNNESELRRSAAILSKARPYEELEIDHADPRSVVQQLLGDMLSGRLTVDEERSLLYHGSQVGQKHLDQGRFQQINFILQSHLGGAGLPGTTVADVALSNTHYNVEGKESSGYKVIVETPGAEAQDLYVVRDGSSYGIAGFSASATAVSEDLGLLALREIEKKNLRIARQWLDRARDKVHISASDDPLDGQSFAYFWTKGQMRMPPRCALRLCFCSARKKSWDLI
jgi:tetratricopeptide (TPR) repeat protein